MNKTLIEMKGGVEMASTKDYLDFILEQLSGLDEISYRAMMYEELPAPKKK